MIRSMAQWTGSALKDGTVLQRSTSREIGCAAIAMLEHGMNIAPVADVDSAARPVSPMRIGTPWGTAVCASRTASRALR